MNYNETKQNFDRYIKARIPFIQINSYEKDRVLGMIKEETEMLNLNMYVHNMASGFKNIITGEILSDQKTILGALDYITSYVKTSRNINFVFCDVYDIKADSVTARYFANVLEECEKNSCSIIVISDEEIWPIITRLGVTIDLELPNQEEIEEIVKKTVSPYIGQINSSWDENDYKEVANILKGLGKKEIKNVILSTLIKGSLTNEDIVELKFTKDNMFSNLSGLEKIEVDPNLSFGGLENLRNWLTDKKELLSASKKEQLIKRGIKPPRGVLIMGVPGCGKSLTAKAISNMWKIPLYLLDFSTIQGMYVGQSEQRLKTALETAEYVSPCVLWIDEIEKGLSAGTDSSGVTTRLIGQFLFWLQECKKDVFVLATANEVEKLPPELLRKGRFDEIFFVNFPNKKERKEIIDLYIKKYMQKSLEEETLNTLCDLSNKFTGADIESVIREVAYEGINKNSEVTNDKIINAFKSTVSLYHTNKEKVEKIIEWAKERTKNASSIDEEESQIERLEI